VRRNEGSSIRPDSGGLHGGIWADGKDLMEDSVSESAAVLAATADYRLDRHDAFKIKPERCALLVIDMQAGFVRHGSANGFPRRNACSSR
jgi:hypothetical protein